MDLQRPAALPRRKAESQTEQLVDELFGEPEYTHSRVSGSRSSQSNSGSSSYRAATAWSPPVVPAYYPYSWPPTGDRPSLRLVGDRHPKYARRPNWPLVLGLGAVTVAAGVAWWSYRLLPSRLTSSQPLTTIATSPESVVALPQATTIEQPSQPALSSPSMFASSIDLDALTIEPESSSRTRTSPRTRSGRSRATEQPGTAVAPSPDISPRPVASAPPPSPPPPPPPAPTYTPAPPPTTVPKIELVGVMGTNSPTPSALVMVGNAMQSVSVGESIQAGWTIAAIDGAGVHVTNGSHTFSVQIGLGSSQ